MIFKCGTEVLLHFLSLMIIFWVNSFSFQGESSAPTVASVLPDDLVVLCDLLLTLKFPAPKTVKQAQMIQKTGLHLNKMAVSALGSMIVLTDRKSSE